MTPGIKYEARFAACYHTLLSTLSFCCCCYFCTSIIQVARERRNYGRNSTQHELKPQNKTVCSFSSPKHQHLFRIGLSRSFDCRLSFRNTNRITQTPFFKTCNVLLCTASPDFFFVMCLRIIVEIQDDKDHWAFVLVFFYWTLAVTKVSGQNIRFYVVRRFLRRLYSGEERKLRVYLGTDVTTEREERRESGRTAARIGCWDTLFRVATIIIRVRGNNDETVTTSSCEGSRADSLVSLMGDDRETTGWFTTVYRHGKSPAAGMSEPMAQHHSGEI